MLFRSQYAYESGLVRPLTHINSKQPIEDSHDIALLLVLVKIGRIATGEFVEDNYNDAAKYLMLAREIGRTMGRRAHP